MEKFSEWLDLVTSNRFIAAAVIVFISLIAAVIVDFFITRVCRVLTRRTKTSIDDDIIALIHNPIRITVLLLGLWIAVKALGLPIRP
ncbi:MAG: hypothetical protein ABIA59_00650, partial [Candidatus Latescibacterota bacterium]